MLSVLLLFTFGLSLASANVGSISSRRSVNLDYTVYEKRARNTVAGFQKSQIETPLSVAKLFHSASLPEAASWDGVPSMEKLFLQSRDARWIESPGRPPRRIFWMYPDDGCFARAGLLNKYYHQNRVPLPSKVFAFGNLSVDSPFSLRGKVGWWYHTAPIVTVGGRKFVIDPSVELSRPLLIDEWLGRMGDPAQIKIAICSSGTYLPVDDCRSESDGSEPRATGSRSYYLSKEEKRVRSLDLDAEALGDKPPW